MQFGTAVHGAVLEPHRNDIYVTKTLSWATKEGKAEKERLEATGLPILDQRDALAVQEIARIVNNHPVAGKLLDEARAYQIAPESAIYWQGYIAGVVCKAKIDAMTEDYILDLKTCVDASPKGFSQQIARFDYALQAAHYIEAAYHETGKRKKFVFIAVEKTAPYAVGVYELDAASTLIGRSQMERAGVIYGRCMDSGIWPGFEPAIQRISVPAWMKLDDEFQDDDKEIDF
jgi:hypothetical protein